MADAGGGDVILGPDGKPLTGKALKKARRAALVAAKNSAPTARYIFL